MFSFHAHPALLPVAMVFVLLVVLIIIMLLVVIVVVATLPRMLALLPVVVIFPVVFMVVIETLASRTNTAASSARPSGTGTQKRSRASTRTWLAWKRSG